MPNFFMSDDGALLPLNDCPFCISTMVYVRDRGLSCQVFCPGCLASGPAFQVAANAVVMWNRMALGPETEGVPQAVKS